MIPTPLELEKIELSARLRGCLDRYVYLREDAEGRYIEYAFLEGRPHDCRCLSWYDAPHPEYMKNHPNTFIKCHNVDELYYLNEFACDNQSKSGPEHCSAGHPCEKCKEFWAHNWTYKEPVKCACWCLEQPGMPEVIYIPIELALELSREGRI